MQLGLDSASLLLVAADEVDSRGGSIPCKFSSSRLADAAGAANWSMLATILSRRRDQADQILRQGLDQVLSGSNLILLRS